MSDMPNRYAAIGFSAVAALVLYASCSSQSVDHVSAYGGKPCPDAWVDHNNQWRCDEPRVATSTPTATGPTKTATDTPTPRPTATATLVPIQIKDDPYWPNVQYEAPVINEERSSTDLYIYQLFAIKIRNEGAVIYRLHFSNVFTAETWRNWDRLTLRGGTFLEIEDVDHEVSRCWGISDCLFTETLRASVPRAELTGELRVKAHAERKEFLMVVPESFVHRLVETVEKGAR